MKQKCYGIIFVGKKFEKIFVSDSLKHPFALFLRHKNLYKFKTPFPVLSKSKNPTIKVGFILDNSYYITTFVVSYHMLTKGPELYLLGNK